MQMRGMARGPLRPKAEKLDLSICCPLSRRFCCKTLFGLAAGLVRERLGSSVEGVAAPTPDGRLGWASSCERSWGTAEQLDESPQVLRGCGEQHLVPRAAQASQSKAVEPEDALHVRESHLDFLALAR